MEKFDIFRNSFFISFGISALILFCNVDLDKFPYFGNLDLNNNLTLLLLLFVNIYFFYELSFSFYSVKSIKNDKFNKFHFIICSCLFSILLIKIIVELIEVNKALNNLIYSFLVLITTYFVFNIYFSFRRFLIHRKVLKTYEMKNDDNQFKEAFINIENEYKNKTELINNILSLYVASDIVKENKIKLFIGKISKYFYDLLILLINLVFLIVSLDYLLKKNSCNYFYLFGFIFFIDTIIIVVLEWKKYFYRLELELKSNHNLLFYEPFFEHLSDTDIKITQKNIKKHELKNSKDKYKSSEKKLFNLIFTSNLKGVKTIIQENKIDINFIDSTQGWTFLHCSVAQSEYEITKLLLENGADPNIKNGIGNLPINYSVKYNDIEIVKLLIDYHSKLDLNDTNGNSIFYYVIENRNIEMFKLLIKNGGSLKGKCNGMSILKFSQFKNAGLITKYIKDLMKK